MRVSPISFGKAIRVNGSISDAYDIARLANEKKVSKSERSAQKEAKAIFDDVSIAPAQVMTYITPYNDELVYVVSGKESKKLDRINEQVATGIIQAGDALLRDSETHKYHKFDLSKRRQMNQYNQRKRDLALNSTTNYILRALYNDDNTSVREIERQYSSVYAVAGTSEQIEELNKIIAKTRGYATSMDATHLYKGSFSDGQCAKAANEGKEIAFIVTGKAANRALSFMDYGWSSVNGVSKRLQKFISLDDVKTQAKQIQEAMEYDFNKEQK